MKTLTLLAAAVLTLGLASTDADAAKRFGGGGYLGKQRPAPTMKEAPKDAPAAAPSPATPAQAKPAAAAAPAPQPSFMSRWGGLLAGLGIGVLLASLFGAELGPIVGLILAALLALAVIALLFRFFFARKTPEARAPMQFAGIGSALPPAERFDSPSAARMEPQMHAAPIAIPGFQVEPFLRVAKTSFIRLQAANDARDLDDIRDYTTPEMYAELAMQIRERGDAPQRTEVVALDASMVEAVVEGDYEIASVRFSGLIREDGAANPESFDEVWHVRKNARDPKAPWLIAGIQQAA